MDTVVKQRVLGVIVLVALLGFCLTVLLRGNKTPQPHLAQINTHPPITQTTSAMINDTAENLTTSQPSANAGTMPSSKTTASVSSNNSAFAGTAADLTAPAATPTTAPAESANPAQSGPISASSQTQVNPSPQTSAQNTVPTADNITTKPATAASLPAANMNLGSSSSASARASYSDVSPQQREEAATTSSSAAPAVSSHHRKASVAKVSAHPSSASTSAVGSGLVVQVGTFSVHANAETLVETLRKKGFAATAQKMTIGKGEMTRVIVGGKGLSSSEAHALQAKLEKTMNLKGFVVSHTPKASAPASAKTSSSKTKKASAANQQAVTIPQDEG
jgi:cell division septation protein DedD